MAPDSPVISVETWRAVIRTEAEYLLGLVDNNVLGMVAVADSHLPDPREIIYSEASMDNLAEAVRTTALRVNLELVEREPEPNRLFHRLPDGPGHPLLE